MDIESKNLRGLYDKFVDLLIVKAIDDKHV